MRDTYGSLSREQILQLANRLIEDASTTDAPSEKLRATAKDTVVQRMAAAWMVNARHSKRLSFASMARTMGVSTARMHQLYGALVSKFPELDAD